MRLFVYVLEAKELRVKDSFVKIKAGRHRSKTRILRNTVNPVWNEEFIFNKVRDVDEEAVFSVYEHCDDSGFFKSSSVLLGRVRIPIRTLLAEDNQTLPPTWFSLHKTKTENFINEDCGKILLILSLHENGHTHMLSDFFYSSNATIEEPKESDGSCVSSPDVFGSKSSSNKAPEGKHIMKTIVNRLERLFHKNEEDPKTDTSSELSSSTSEYVECIDEHASGCSFEEAIDQAIQSRGSQHEMPENLQGGVLLDQEYIVSPSDLNKFLFEPNSQFRRALAELQGTTNLQEGPWVWKSGEIPCLARVVSYTRAATKLVRAVKATEEQMYIRADGREFGVFISVSTPEAPYGNNFKVELLYKILPGPEQSSGEESEKSARLVVSWGINFTHHTVMRGVIEGGVKQGLKESFDQFANLLAKDLKVVNYADLSNKDHLLATVETEHQSNWELAVKYFWSLPVVSTVLIVLYVIVHILLCEPRSRQGLEFRGVDLPDSFGEVITGGILVVLLEHTFNMVSHFVQAKFHRGSDHGVKAQGDGWVLTVALIEGVNLSSLDSLGGFSDPYVVFTCNGITRTSSVKLQTRHPQWNEILEFGALEEPPAVLDVEAFDFDGPVGQATSLGRAEINFLKHTSTELVDMWVTLEGKLAQASQTKLHLRIFLDNNNGVETIREYLTKMEKEVGKKLNLRSPHKNSMFQKLFGLPPEEFLISEFTCSLKRKLPLQGRLFLSSRIIGFYANLFGHKTKFFFLWEDIDDIQELPPSLSSVGSPLLLILLRKGRGLDACHYAKSQDEKGRLRFYFQSFLSFGIASRTIVALWRTRTLSPDEKARIAAEQADEEEKGVAVDDSGFR